MKFDYFRKSVKKIQFSLNMTRKTGAVHEDQYTFMTIPRLAARVRNVLDKGPI